MSSRLLSKSQLLGTTVVVTGFTLAGSALNFVAQATLAYRFGAGAAIDAYSYAISLPIFLAGLAASVISYTAVPMMSQANDDELRARQIGRSLSAWLMVLCTVIVLLAGPAIAFQPMLVPPARDILQYPSIDSMIFLAWVAGAVQLLTALTVAQLNADGRPVIAASLGLTISSGTITALLLFPYAGITIAMLGLVGGSIAGAITGLLVARSHLLPPAFSIEVKHEMIRLGKSALWAVLALSCFASFFVIDAIWASRLGEGTLAAMGYAHRLVIGIGSLAVAGPSALFIPRLARLVAANDGAGFRRFLFWAASLVGLVGGLCAIGIFLFAHPLVGLLFERGAFDQADTLLVATALRHMAPGVVTMLVSVILLRAVFCLPGLNVASALLGALFTLSYFFFSWLMLDLGIEGLANSYSISWTLFALCNVVLIARRSRFSALAPAGATS